MSKGVSLFFAILLLSVLTTALLSLISISISQIKVIWSIGDSIAAFCAADSGVELALYRIRKQDNFENFTGTLNGTSFEVSIDPQSLETIIKSVGTNKKIQRAIEVRY